MISQHNLNLNILFVFASLYTGFWFNPFSQQKKTRVSYLGSYWVSKNGEPKSLSQWCLYFIDEVCLRSSCLPAFLSLVLVTFGPSHIPTHCHAAVWGLKKLSWLQINPFFWSETHIIPEANLFSLTFYVFTLHPIIVMSECHIIW